MHDSGSEARSTVAVAQDGSPRRRETAARDNLEARYGRRLSDGQWESAKRELLAFVRKHAGGCRQVVAVCTGALILQAVGLLAGRRATTHWQFLDRLRSSRDVTVTEDRFVRDGTIWTAAGVSAGIDVALALVADQAGEDVAGHVQLAMEYYPSARRYGQAHVIPEAPGYLKMEGAASSARNVSTV